MIRYPILERELEKRVESMRPGWLDRAGDRTAAMVEAGEYDGKSGIWSDIKRVYMELQGFKCGFCERRLEKSRYGNIEHDVEHFRPKAKVRIWPSDDDRSERAIDFDFPLGDDSDPGYYGLAFELENYLISCKTCNSSLKGNYFPIAGERIVDKVRSRELDDEKPYLIYPIGARDTRPEELITFKGITPVPIGTRGHKRRRAEVTIRFFELDTREVLLEERSETLLELFLALNASAGSTQTERDVGNAVVSRILDPRSPHTNCARSFHRLWSESPAGRNQAMLYVDAIVDYLASLG